MAILQSTKRAFVRDIREAVFNMCSGLGVLAGIFWGLSHPAKPNCPSRFGADPSRAVGDCARSALVESITPYLLGIGLGAVAGTVIGVFIARLIPMPDAIGRRPGSRVRLPTKTARPAAQAPAPVGPSRAGAGGG